MELKFGTKFGFFKCPKFVHEIVFEKLIITDFFWLLEFFGPDPIGFIKFVRAGFAPRLDVAWNAIIWSKNIVKPVQNYLADKFELSQKTKPQGSSLRKLYRLDTTELVIFLFKSQISRRKLSWKFYLEEINKFIPKYKSCFLLVYFTLKIFLNKQSRIKIKTGLKTGFQLRLTVVDTPGFADAIDNRNAFSPIIEYIDKQFEEIVFKYI